MKKILSVVLVVMVLISVFVETQFTVMATQSMSGNFNKGYSMTNNPATNMVNIAVAQNERTQGSLGYSEAWCADFVSDCAKLAGQSAAIPFNGVVQSMYSAVINAGGKVVGSAQAGDLVFFTNGSGYGHVGIATDGTHNISGNIYYLGASPSKVKILENRYEGFKSWTFVRPNYQGVATPVNNPQGCFDWVKSNSPGTIQVHGWAFDRDNLGASLAIHIYVGGPAGSGAPGYAITANKSRPDVNNAYPGVGNNHGFDDTIRVSKTGLQTIYVYAINVGGGNDNPLLGYQNVVIKELTGEINISNGDYYIANAS
ncbi:MAG: CHAP domain-containing protein, partial [Ruminococcus sp.]